VNRIGFGIRGEPEWELSLRAGSWAEGRKHLRAWGRTLRPLKGWHRKLVPQNQQFDILGELAATTPHEQPQQRREREIRERKEHPSMLPDLAPDDTENRNLVLEPLTKLNASCSRDPRPRSGTGSQVRRPTCFGSRTAVSVRV
jgi:hypothetical protein